MSIALVSSNTNSGVLYGQVNQSSILISLNQTSSMTNQSQMANQSNVNQTASSSTGKNIDVKTLLNYTNSAIIGLKDIKDKDKKYWSV